MEQYIPKSALVAEIKRRLNHQVCLSVEREIREQLLSGLLLFIDTLEVKGVDLEARIDDYINSHFTEGCDGGMISDWYKVLGGVHYKDLKEIAKEFFELGLKASCSVDLTPDLDTLFEEKGIDPDSKEAKIIKEAYYVALDKLAQKGEEV